MKIAIVLGNRMNDDGSLSELCKARLSILLHADAAFHFDKIILSGGIANKTAGIAESTAMFEALTAKGFNPGRLVKEDQSLTTKENALFSVPLAHQLGADEIVVITSPEHFARNFLNPIKLFQKAMEPYPEMKLSIYSEEA